MSAGTERAGALAWTPSLVDGLLRRRGLLLAAVAVVSAFAATGIDRMRFENSIEVWFLEGDPELAVYREFRERFQADEIAMVGVFADDVFDPDVLARIDRITRGAWAAPHVSRVRSLADVQTFFDRSGDLVIRQLMEALPEDRAEASRVRELAFESPLIHGNYVSDDARSAAVVVEMDLDEVPNAEEGERALVAELRRIVEVERGAGVRIVMSGAPPFNEAFRSYSARDARTFGIAAILVAFGLTFLVFRDARASAIPLLVVVLSLLWTAGLMGAAGVGVTILSVCLVSLVLTVGVADSIHVLAAYRHWLARGMQREAAIRETVTGLLWPCFLTSATTAAGLLSLSASTLQPVREFGWMAAVGVVIAFILSMTVIPVLLSLLPTPPASELARHRTGWVGRFLAWLGRPTAASARVVLAASAGLLLGSAFLLPKITVGSNPLGYFKSDAPIRQATEEIDRALGGSTSIEFLVEADGGGLRDPRRLARLEAVQASLEARPGISKVTSVVDSLKEVRRVLDGAPGGGGRLPESRAEAAQLHLLIEGADDYPMLVQDDASVGRISARARYTHAPELVAMIPELERQLAEERDRNGLDVRPTGQVKLIANMETQLLSSQIRSFLTAFAVISAMMFLITRSVRLGFLCMIPNLVPIVMGLALLPVLGFQLDPGTVMIGSIALGLVVDDTVHFIVRLQRQLALREGLREAVAHTLEEAGRPIVLTSLVLCGGFLVMALSSFNPNIHFGVASALVILLALVADLVMLPAALLVLRPRI